MGGIGTYSNTSYTSLYIIRRNKNIFLFFNYRKNPLIVTRYSCQIHRNNSFCLFIYYRLQHIIIHLQGIFLNVNKNNFGSNRFLDSSNV